MALWSNWQRQLPQKQRFVGSTPTGATRIAVCVYGRIADENLCMVGGNARHIYGRHSPHEAGMPTNELCISASSFQNITAGL